MTISQTLTKNSPEARDTNAAMLAQLIQHNVKVRLDDGEYHIGQMPRNLTGSLDAEGGTLLTYGRDLFAEATLSRTKISKTRFISRFPAGTTLFSNAKIPEWIVDNRAEFHNTCLVHQRQSSVDRLIVDNVIVENPLGRFVNFDSCGLKKEAIIKNSIFHNINNTGIYFSPSESAKGVGTVHIIDNVANNDETFIMTGSGSYHGFVMIGQYDTAYAMGNQISGLKAYRGTIANGVFDIDLRARISIRSGNTSVNNVLLGFADASRNELHPIVNDIFNVKSSNVDGREMQRIIKNEIVLVEQDYLERLGVDMRYFGQVIGVFPNSPGNLQLLELSDISVDGPCLRLRREPIWCRRFISNNVHMRFRRSHWMHRNASTFNFFNTNGTWGGQKTSNVTRNCSVKIEERPMSRHDIIRNGFPLTWWRNGDTALLSDPYWFEGNHRPDEYIFENNDFRDIQVI